MGKHIYEEDTDPVEDAISEPEGDKYRVIAYSVFIRGTPHTGGKKVGSLTKGTIVSGEVQKGWLCLDKKTRDSVAGVKCLEAYVLIDGSFIARRDLGRLLELVSRSPEKGNKKERVVASLLQRADRANTVLRGNPLSFEVVSEDVNVCSQPDVNSPALRQVQKGDVVDGWPSGNWLHLGAKQGWVQIDGTTDGFGLYLEARWGKVSVRQQFLEAIIIDWPGLNASVHACTYAVEWKALKANGEGTVAGDMLCKSSTAHLTGLPMGARFRLRVLACVLHPEQGQGPLRLNGQWHTLETLCKRAGADGDSGHRIPPDNSREGPGATGCRGYVAPEDPSGHGIDSKMVLCYRCGRPLADHLKHSEAQPSAAKVDGSSSTSNSAYEVVSNSVWVRAEPSVKSDKLGVLHQGQCVDGQVRKGWLMLTQGAASFAGVPKGKTAYVLIDGKELGIGALLRPCLEDGELSGSDDSGDAGEPLPGRRVEDIWSSPMGFIVTCTSAAVRRIPKNSGELLDALPQGERVKGYPKGRWLRLEGRRYSCSGSLVQGWVSLNQQLSPMSFRVHALKTFAEAAILRWDQVPARMLQYSLEYKEGKESTIVLQAGSKMKASFKHVHGLKGGIAYQLRVVASAMIPGTNEADPRSVFARVASQWSEVTTSSPVDADEEAKKNYDYLGKVRGECAGCSCCRGFIITSYSQMQRPEEVLCRRCGCACTSHVDTGWYHKGKTEEQEEWEQAQERLNDPYADCKTWRVEDAKAGLDRIRYIMKKVMLAKNKYEVLGVRPDAPAKDIRTAYRQISLTIHPDKVQSSGATKDPRLLKEAEATFKHVSAALEYLENKGKRAAYDKTL